MTTLTMVQKASVAAVGAAFMALGALGNSDLAYAATVGPISYTWTGTESTQTQRLFRDSFPSNAASPKPFPGAFGSGTYGYQTFTFFNNGPDSPVTVDVTNISTNSFIAAYLNSYQPTNMALNYLGDLGSSLPQVFSFLVPANQQFLVVAQTVNSLSGTIGDSFSFTVSGDNVSTTPIPTPALLPGLIGMGVAAIRKRKAEAVEEASEA